MKSVLVITACCLAGWALNQIGSESMMALGVFGTLVKGALGGFGEKPKIPGLPFLDTGEVQRAAVAGNIAALPEIEQLASAVNRFNQAELLGLIETVFPSFRRQVGRAEQTTESLLRGQIPADVSAAVTRGSAARSAAGGFAGSPASRNLLGRDLGLTSLQLQQQGLGNLGGLLDIARASSPVPFNTASMFITPQQKLSFDLQQTAAQFERNLLAAQIKAMPEPFDVAIGEAVGQLTDTVSTIVLTAAGGAVGGALGGAMGASMGSQIGGAVGGGGGGGGGGGASQFGNIPIGRMQQQSAPASGFGPSSGGLGGFGGFGGMAG